MNSLIYHRHAYAFRKNISRPSCRSVCLQTKKISGDLHNYVEGLLYLEKDDKVVETKLRICRAARCTTNMTSSLNNITPLADTIYIERSSLNEISQSELVRIKDQGFNKNIT